MADWTLQDFFTLGTVVVAFTATVVPIYLKRIDDKEKRAEYKRIEGISRTDSLIETAMALSFAWKKLNHEEHAKGSWPKLEQMPNSQLEAFNVSMHRLFYWLKSYEIDSVDLKQATDAVINITSETSQKIGELEWASQNIPDFDMQEYYSALEDATRQIVDANVRLEIELGKIASRLRT